MADTIDELVEMADADGPLAVVAIDIPIGLPDRGRRQAEVLARKAVGTLTSSVFMTPTRAALDVLDHPTASARNRELTGEGISRQAFSLKPKLHQVERWVRQTHHRVVEVHPEVSFAELADAPLTVHKSTWAGAKCRRQLLADAGVLLAVRALAGLSTASAVPIGNTIRGFYLGVAGRGILKRVCCFRSEGACLATRERSGIFSGGYGATGVVAANTRVAEDALLVSPIRLLRRGSGVPRCAECPARSLLGLLRPWSENFPASSR